MNSQENRGYTIYTIFKCRVYLSAIHFALSEKKKVFHWKNSELKKYWKQGSSGMCEEWGIEEWGSWETFI